ncbi:hypothetical protein HN588_12170 [Candidatus Bathyarchaeota archaeon]|nr:hypothetical protein [Candidatus Bathyarchaeota archaeon]
MKIRVHIDSIVPMLAECRKARNQGFFNEEVLRSILEHPDYVFERRRYGERAPLDAFIQFLQSLAAGKPDHQGIGDIEVRVQTWQDFWHNMEPQAAAIHQFIEELTPEYLDDCVKIALNGLPENHDYEDVDFILTLGYGGSIGYVFEGSFAYDAISAVHGTQSARGVIAHESHHLALEQLPFTFDGSPPLHGLLMVFAGEGLACKYCNNTDGVLTHRLDPNHPVDMSSDWCVFHEHFSEDFGVFKEQFVQVKAGAYKTPSEVFQALAPSWRYCSSPEWWAEKHERLDYQPSYYMGCQLFGVIHDAFGKEKVYEALFHPEHFASIFNIACAAMKVDEGYRLPE